MQLICSKQRPLAQGPKAVHSPCTRLGRYPRTQLKPTQAFRLDDSNTPNTSAAKSAARTVADPASDTKHTSPAPAYKQSATASKGSSWRASSDSTDSVQPLWRKPSFPYVVAIALATLPYDLAYQQYQPRSGRKAAYSRSSHFSRTPAAAGHSSSSSSSGLTSRPARHAKASPTAQHVSTPTPAPAGNIDAVKREAAAAAAAAVDSNHSQPQQQQQQQQSTVGTSKHAKASSASKLAAEASQAANAAKSAAATAKGAASRSSSAAQAAADRRGNTAPARADAAAAAAAAKQPPPSWGAATGAAGPAAAAPAAAAAGPVDSWDASDDSAMFSDEDAEQQAKAMVIELLTHPKDTEDALMRAAAQGPGGGDGSAGGPLSVSPDYIDALVEAVKDPGVGMPHHDALPGNPPEVTSSTSSSGNPGTTDAQARLEAQTPAAAQDSPAAVSAGPGAQQGAGGNVGPARQAPSASLWSWLDASPQSSQEEEF